MKLTHPHSGATVEVKPEDADRYQSQGWTPVAEKPTDEKKGK